jgi:PIN domain nuclease of toxin-antitoxin system
VGSRKESAGRQTAIAERPGRLVSDALAPNVEVLALERDVVIEAMRLPEFPTRDPADELIVASARIHNLTLITTDTKLQRYRHARIHYFKPLADREKR